jgi:hypothetical protein
VPPIVTESGITLNAPPPWNFATVTTCKGIEQIYRIITMKICSTDSKFGLQENVVIEEASWIIHKLGLSEIIEEGNKLVKCHEFHKELRRSEEKFSLKATSKSWLT